MVYREVKISARVVLVLDPSDSATPAMVYGGNLKKDRRGRTTGNFSATFDCGCGEGELLGSHDTMSLTQRELAELEKHEDLSAEYYAEARKDCPEYQ